MNKFLKLSLIASLFLGYLIVFLFIFEIIGEFSPHVEGFFYTNDIKWRYPLILGLLTFGYAYLVGGKTKITNLGFGLLVGIVSAVLLVYIVVIISMTSF